MGVCTMQGTSLKVENGIIGRPKTDKGTAAPHLSHVSASHRQGLPLTNSRSLPGTSLIGRICGCVVCGWSHYEVGWLPNTEVRMFGSCP